MNQTREKVILSMCYTWRKDYGLDKPPGVSISSGITQSERQYIHDMMSKLFDRDIAPYMEFKRPRGPAHSCDIPGILHTDFNQNN